MARIQINDLQAPEKELTEQEMGSVTGGFRVSYGGVSGVGSWVYRGTQTKTFRKKVAYKAYRYVSVRRSRRIYSLRGGGAGAWR